MVFLVFRGLVEVSIGEDKWSYKSLDIKEEIDLVGVDFDLYSWLFVGYVLEFGIRVKKIGELDKGV